MIGTYEELVGVMTAIFNAGIHYETDVYGNRLIAVPFIDFEHNIETKKDLYIAKFGDENYQLVFREFLDDGTYLGELESISPKTKDPNKILRVIKAIKACED